MVTEIPDSANYQVPFLEEMAGSPSPCQMHKHLGGADRVRT